MIKRHFHDKPAYLTFTSDFHELLEGDLRPGGPVTLRYDPHRIVPEGDDYRFGDAQRPIYLHAVFHRGGAEISRILSTPGGTVDLPVRDETGQGYMLAATLDVPADADYVGLWFRFETSTGETVWDNDHGTCFWFRFPSSDIEVVTADVATKARAKTGSFVLEVAAAPTVERVAARFLAVNDSTFAKTQVDLVKTDRSDARGRSIWVTADMPVPAKAILRFKLYYWLDGRRYKDDNSSRYYLAPLPEPEDVPPPPADLAAASAAWK